MEPKIIDTVIEQIIKRDKIGDVLSSGVNTHWHTGDGTGTPEARPQQNINKEYQNILNEIYLMLEAKLRDTNMTRNILSLLDNLEN